MSPDGSNGVHSVGSISGIGGIGAFSDIARGLSSLLGKVITKGEGGTMTTDMVDQAKQIKPAVEQANG